MTPDRLSEAAPPHEGLSPQVGVSIVVSYLLLHMVWAQLVRGPYAFVIERVIFLILVLPIVTVALRVPLHQAIGYLRLPKRKDLKFYFVVTSAIVVLRLALKAAAGLIKPGTDIALPTVERFIYECIIPPLNEEPVFRGLIILSLVSLFGRRKWPVIVLSTAIFVACHNVRQWETVIATLILGLLLGIAFIRTRSLSGSVLLHALWNAGLFLPAL
jgi:membrane protease YdiL (CAAX protease family)